MHIRKIATQASIIAVSVLSAWSCVVPAYGAPSAIRIKPPPGIYSKAPAKKKKIVVYDKKSGMRLTLRDNTIPLGTSHAFYTKGNTFYFRKYSIGQFAEKGNILVTSYSPLVMYRVKSVYCGDLDDYITVKTYGKNRKVSRDDAVESVRLMKRKKSTKGRISNAGKQRISKENRKRDSK